MKKRVAAALAAGLLLLLASAPEASADRIYLKNGRIIMTESVRIQDQSVVFAQYGGTVSIPLAVVDRIEETEEAGPEAAPTLSPQEVAARDAAAEGAAADEETAADAQSGTQQAAVEAAAAEGAAAEGATAVAGATAGEEEEPAEDPRQTQQYWRARLQPLFAQMRSVEDRLTRFRQLAPTSADAQRQVVRLELQLTGLQNQVEAVRREARAIGVPPGWLRR